MFTLVNGESLTFPPPSVCVPLCCCAAGHPEQCKPTVKLVLFPPNHPSHRTHQVVGVWNSKSVWGAVNHRDVCTDWKIQHEFKHAYWCKFVPGKTHTQRCHNVCVQNILHEVGLLIHHIYSCSPAVHYSLIPPLLWVHHAYIYLDCDTQIDVCQQTLCSIFTHWNSFRWLYKHGWIHIFPLWLEFIYCVYVLALKRHTNTVKINVVCHVVLTAGAGGDGWCIHEAPLDQDLQASSSKAERGLGGSTDDRWLGGWRKWQSGGLWGWKDLSWRVGNVRNMATFF